MIVPKHCKEVGLREVNFPLTAESIMKNLKGRKVYHITRFLILKRGEEYAVIEVKKEKTAELLSKVRGAKIISLPEDCHFIKDEAIDVMNIQSMAEKARNLGTKTVIFEGEFGHLSFIHKTKFTRIRVLDVVPPYPSKLERLVDKVLASGSISMPIRVETRLINLKRLAQSAKTKEILFPCYVPIRIRGRRSLFLDHYPKILDATIVGCDLSRRIAQLLYGRTMPFINMCPRDLAIIGRGTATLVRCCKVSEGSCLKEDSFVSVPWGATLSEVTKALNYLLKQ